MVVTSRYHMLQERLGGVLAVCRLKDASYLRVREVIEVVFDAVGNSHFCTNY